MALVEFHIDAREHQCPDLSFSKVLWKRGCVQHQYPGSKRKSCTTLMGFSDSKSWRRPSLRYKKARNSEGNCEFSSDKCSKKSLLCTLLTTSYCPWIVLWKFFLRNVWFRVSVVQPRHWKARSPSSKMSTAKASPWRVPILAVFHSCRVAMKPYTTNMSRALQQANPPQIDWPHSESYMSSTKSFTPAMIQHIWPRNDSEGHRHRWWLARDLQKTKLFQLYRFDQDSNWRSWRNQQPFERSAPWHARLEWMDTGRTYK